MVQPVYNLNLTTATTYVSGLTAADIAQSGFLTSADIHTSGYVRNKDLVGSGYIRDINGINGPVITLVGSGGTTIWKDGQTIQISSSGGAGGSGISLDDVHNDIHTSGYIRNIDFIQSGFQNTNDITSSGYVRHTDMLNSGYLRHEDLLSSGYVRSVNGLKNTPTIVGSGTIGVWVDGNTIQVGAAAGGTTLAAVQQDLYMSGYIRNVDFVSSGFPTKNELHGSGYIRNVDFVSSGFTTLNAVQSDLYGSGYVRNVDLLGSGYVRNINGGSDAITIIGSGNINVWRDNQTIQINATSAGGGLSQQQVMAIGSLRI